MELRAKVISILLAVCVLVTMGALSFSVANAETSYQNNPVEYGTLATPQIPDLTTATYAAGTGETVNATLANTNITATGSATSDSATADSTKDNTANGSIPTNEGNATVWIFAGIIVLAAAAGVAFFTVSKKKSSK